jgi:hypothetical protein
VRIDGKYLPPTADKQEVRQAALILAWM